MRTARTRTSGVALPANGTVRPLDVRVVRSVANGDSGLAHVNAARVDAIEIPTISSRVAVRGHFGGGEHWYTLVQLRNKGKI